MYLNSIIFGVCLKTGSDVSVVTCVMRAYCQELAELSVSTFKHIGRLRTARLIGKELASFYLYVHHT